MPKMCCRSSLAAPIPSLSMILWSMRYISLASSRRRRPGTCAIANPIYQRVLIDYFRPRQMGLQGAILANGDDFRPYGSGQQLQMAALLTRFRAFVERRGREAFKVTPMPQEATGQYLLMAYLDIAVRQLGGDLFTEVAAVQDGWM